MTPPKPARISASDLKKYPHLKALLQGDVKKSRAKSTIIQLPGKVPITRLPAVWLNSEKAEAGIFGFCLGAILLGLAAAVI